MHKLAAISPRTNAFMSEGGGSTPEDSVFERVFSDMAYGLLESKMPDLAAQVVTFKILESDIEEGRGVGVFIIKKPSTELYLPVILNSNSIKPPEMFYAKSIDAFLPLDKGWLAEMDKIGTGEMGGGVHMPETVSADPGLEGLVTPPYSSGRVSYASASGAVVNGPSLPDVLSQCPGRVKRAFAEYLTGNKGALKTAVKYHGKGIIEVLKPRDFVDRFLDN